MKKILLTMLFAVALAACNNDNIIDDGQESVVTFYPRVQGDTRAIGEALQVNVLDVAVYEGNRLQYTTSKSLADAVSSGIDLTLIMGRTYSIIFWAQNDVRHPYSFAGEKTTVNVDYSGFSGEFADMENYDALFNTDSFVFNGTQGGNINLVRPVAILNFADATTKPDNSIHKAVLTLTGVATGFNPFADGDARYVISDKEVQFTFNSFTDETLTTDEATYNYVTSNYLFPVGRSLGATLSLQDKSGAELKSTVINAGSQTGIPMMANMRTNVLGSIVQAPAAWSVWDGETKTQPSTDAQNRYVIDEASDIAWLSVADNAGTLEKNRTFVFTTDIDMAGKEGLASIELPEGSTLEGDGHTIKGLSLSGGFLGNVTQCSVQNITVEGAEIGGNQAKISGTGHVGVLVNTLKGSATFTNVVVKGSSVSTTNGAAGGMIGYIARKAANDRSETLNVIFDNCHVVETSIDGSQSEGHFVGLLRGYDNGETLTFNDNCSLTSTDASDFVSPYTEGNEGAWLTDKDYTKYNGWLGNEECYRGKVNYGSNRFIPCWDGNTTVEPLLVEGTKATDHKYEVYSAFDLAGVRAKTASPAALYLMENVDMYGQGADGKYNVHANFTKSACNSADDNNFNAFSSIALLEGNNKGIYNLSLNSNGSDRYAFILSGNNNDVHKNISFHNCCTVVPHIEGTDDGQTVDKSYGATVVLSVGGATYTMDNVHAYGCEVFALQKTGIIAGRLVSSTMATIKNCSVNDCYIENYKCECHYQTFKKLFVTAKFYSYGEVGGLVGFIENFATISNCHVKGTEIYAFGQNNQLAGIVPGRHVGQFIGSIRTTGDNGDTIILQNCTIDSGTKCTKTWHKYSKCNMIGNIYYVITSDSKGTVTLDGKSIF